MERHKKKTYLDRDIVSTIGRGVAHFPYKQERVALQERKETSIYKKWQASDNKYTITSNR